MTLAELLVEAKAALENSYLDPTSRVWINLFVNALEDEGWTEQPPQKSEPGPEPKASKLDDEDTSPSPSSKATTPPTKTGSSLTPTPTAVE
jgi:hypothetical protein